MNKPTLLILAPAVWSFSLFLGCELELGDELEIGQIEQSGTTYLSSDLYLDCDEDGNAGTAWEGYNFAISDDTEHVVQMNAGDTIFLSGVTYPFYENYSSGDSALFETWLACASDADLDALDASQTYAKDRPFGSVRYSGSGTNHFYNSSGPSKLTDTHIARAVYTADVAGQHTCWMVYMCGGENERMRISDDSYLGWYNVNQYPGANFCMGADPESDCSLTEQPTKELVNSTASHNAGGPFYWEAGTATDNDTELVVRWSPNLTNCKSSTDASCQGLGTVEGYDHSAYYQTRLVVYQQYGGATCNKDFGSWGSSTCGQPDHHCDTYSYLDVFPIVTGWGNNGWCGSTNPDRTFKIYTQIKKTYDNHNPYGSDLVVTGGTTAKTNLAVYAR